MTSKIPIKYSLLDLALISEGNSLKDTFENAVALAQHVEQLGYTRYWLAEHHNAINLGSSATSILIGYLAAATNTLRIGSGGIMLPNHSPLIVAEQFGTLGSIYTGRIDLGLGRAPGTDRETAQAIRSDFMNAAHSFPKELNLLQQYFSEKNNTSRVRATVAEGVEVPIYILGSSTDSAYLAAAKGLPYAFASHFATTYLQEAIAIYREEFQPSASLKAPYVMAAINVIIADDNERAQQLFTSLLKLFIGILTGNRNYVQPPESMNENLQEVLKHPQVNQMLKYSFVGTKESVKPQIEEFIEKTKTNELIAVTNIFDIEDRKKSYSGFSQLMREIHS